MLRRKHFMLIWACLLLLIVLSSCHGGARRDVNRAVETIFLSLLMIVNIVLFGISALALSFGYAQRKKDKDVLLVIAIVLLVIFSLISFSAFLGYVGSIEQSTFVAIELLLAIAIIVISIRQLHKGVQRKKGGFTPLEKSKKQEQLDDKIPEDEEVI